MQFYFFNEIKNFIQVENIIKLGFTMVNWNELVMRLISIVSIIWEIDWLRIWGGF
jgi:hypothetical protein